MTTFYVAWYVDEHGRPCPVRFWSESDREAAPMARGLVRDLKASAVHRAEGRGIRLKVHRGCYVLVALLDEAGRVLYRRQHDDR